MREKENVGRCRVVVNADDFGFSVGVTDGILRSFGEGVLTSTTVMATMPDCDRAIDLGGMAKRAREADGSAAVGAAGAGTRHLGIGVHLCLTQGQPRTPCGTILDRDGAFPRKLPRLFGRVMAGGARARREVFDEWMGQVAYVAARGLVPTHLDSHKHVHHVPMLQDVVIEVARRWGIKWIRCAREARVAGIRSGGVGYRTLGRFAGRLARKIEKAAERGESVGTTDWFFGLATTGKTDVGVWERVAGAAGAGGVGGVGEIMVHPGYRHDVTAGQTRLLKGREVEMEALVSPRVRAAVEQSGMELVHFGEL